MTGDFNNIFFTKSAKKCPKGQNGKKCKRVKNWGFHSIAATIHIGRESQCLPYAGFIVSGVKLLNGIDIDT